MNAPTTFPPADLLELADKVLSGEWTQPYGNNGWYDAGEWASAAQCAFDTNDWSELAFMVAKEEAFEQFQETISDCEDNGLDFDTWLDHDRPTLGEYLREEYEWRTR